ncbi:MAG: hypothetical protein SOY81_07495 [Dorea longicatena]|nr:hypothetical protein [Dorea longicatena]
MEGRQPKRRKDKYNPYEIYEKDGKYYVSFRNGEKEYKDLEIGKNVYEAFNTFELQDVSHMNVVEGIWNSQKSGIPVYMNGYFRKKKMKRIRF